MWSAAVAMAMVGFAMSAIPDLDSLRWQHRVVVMFADDSGDSKLVEQERLFTGHSPGISERDIQVLRVVGNGDDRRELRKKLHAAAHGFALVLVGKDGSVKLCKTDPVASD